MSGRAMRHALSGVALLVSTAALTTALRADGRESDSAPTPPLRRADGRATARLCTTYSGLPARFGSDPHAGMVFVQGGSFELGSRHGYADERPAGVVAVGPFWIDRTEVTNAQFAAFVHATGYVTSAEREGGAAVFRPKSGGSEGNGAHPPMPWWRFEPGTHWRHPDGPTSSVAERANQPVVQVTHDDAEAYAHWLGRELPSEAQWEYAARAGQQDDDLPSSPYDGAGRATANFWQGPFPQHNTRQDGYEARAPVGCYAANAFGLYDVVGNVWEWTRDAYRGHDEGHCAAEHKVDAPAGERIVVKGGSYVCGASFCSRYRVTARYPQEANLATAHVGFRTVSER